jgi:hypothetical protein
MPKNTNSIANDKICHSWPYLDNFSDRLMSGYARKLHGEEPMVYMQISSA